MNRGISKGLVCGIVIAMALLLTQMTLACTGVCGPCYSGTWPNCVWKGCQPACDGTACKYCSETAGCVCKSWCSSGQSCCTGSPEGSCYGNEQQCCGNAHLCPVKYTCCPGDCCNPDWCQSCVGGSCQQCGGDANEICCLDGTGKCCNWATGESCCEGNCCDAGKYCCQEGTGKCCDVGKDCCAGKCCDAGRDCCAGTCCDSRCCNSFDCEHCVSGSCEPCLRKVGTYAELQQCNKVPDPTWIP